MMINQPATSSKQPAASNPLLALLLIIRPLNVAIAGLSILLAAALVRPFHFTSAVACAILSGMLIAAGANVINDLCDIDIDKINRPLRILPSGKLQPETAQTFIIFLFACGIFFSIFINLAVVAMAVGTSALLVIYSLWLKRRPLLGNLAVSTATALAFIYGALAAHHGLLTRPVVTSIEHATRYASAWTTDWRAGIFPAVFSFLFHFGREVIKDIEDQAGDSAVQARTLPLAYGLTTAQVVATVAFVLLFVVTLLPFHLGIYNSTYFRIVLFGVDSVLIFAIYLLWKQPVPSRMRLVSAVLKADMLVGLAAIYFGQ